MQRLANSTLKPFWLWGLALPQPRISRFPGKQLRSAIGLLTQFPASIDIFQGFVPTATKADACACYLSACDREYHRSESERKFRRKPDCAISNKASGFQAREPGDLITHVTLPPPAPGSRSLYLKLRDRASFEFALASAAVVITVEGGKITRARVALGGVGTKPWRSPEAEAELTDQSATRSCFSESGRCGAARR